MPVNATVQRPSFGANDSLSHTIFNAATVVSVTVPDATTSTEGVVRLAGDLTGSASAPQLVASGVVAGTYGQTGLEIAQITVDAKGRITGATNRTLPDSGATAGTYGQTGLAVAQITVDAKGRVTGAADRSIAAEILAAVREALYPVGEILITHRSGNPATWLGFGTWVRHAAGRALVGLDEGDTDFDAIDKTAGAKTITLDASQIPAHTHGVGTLTVASSGSEHSHRIPWGTADQTSTNINTGADVATVSVGFYGPSTYNDGAHSHTLSGATASVGGGAAHNNVQPSIVVAVWLRTA